MLCAGNSIIPQRQRQILAHTKRNTPLLALHAVWVVQIRPDMIQPGSLVWIGECTAS